MTWLASLLALAVYVAVLLGIAIGSEPAADGSLPAGDRFSREELTRLHQIRDGVAAHRKLPVAQDIREGAMARDTLTELNSRLIREDGRLRQAYHTETLIYRLLGFLGPTEELEVLLAESGAEDLAGFYYPEDDQLFILDDLSDLQWELTIAHEYVHSFQDARFDLQAMDRRAERHPQTELSLTIPCVYEGDASLAAIAYMNLKHGSTWVAQLVREAGEAEPKPSSIPAGVLRYSAFKYSQCVGFVANVYQKHGWDGVDGLYANPPATTEQVLHPDKYFEGEQAVGLKLRDLRPVLGPGWKHLDSRAFGEFDVLNHLVSVGLTGSLAVKAAAGWGGGQLQLYASTRPDSDNAVLNVLLAWDSEADFDEFKDALEKAYSSRNAAFFYGKETDGWSPLGLTGFARWQRDSRRVELVFASEETTLEGIRAELIAPR